MKRIILLHILICSIALAATSCKDDFMTDKYVFGKGDAKVSATLDFKPMSSALTQSRAAGDALKEITSLYVLLYDSNTRELIRSQKIEESEYTEETDAPRGDKDAENGNSAEAQTKRVSFKLSETIPFGMYRMYAVANIPDLLTTYAENIKTVEGLKSLPLTWNKEVSQNGQMIGHFTDGTASVTQEDQPLAVNKASMQLHAWLRRAASKVTIAYDGSELKEGVFIYLQSVQIKDIPLQCYLGKENNVGAEGYTLNCPEEGTDLPDGEIITYHEGDKTDDFEYGEGCAGHRITVGAPHFGSHGETEPALYFYENMQGAGDNMPDKRQDADGNGKLDHPGLPNKPEDPDKAKDWDYRLKDGVPYGTYIEVTAHYISNNSERLGNGSIVYRFMLGQDVINDYNAKRNCHYKLTLKFKNFANEADWHIEYEEPEPGVMTPEPYYISYLYNHSMMYPFKVNTGGRKIEYIKAEIMENNWSPYNADNDIYYTGAPNGVDAPWNGFLSLHKTTQTVLEAKDKDGNDMDPYQANKYHYNQTPKRGEREYKNFILPSGDTSKEYTTDNSEKDDVYRVEKHPTEANTYNIYIPMYTRAKQMVIKTGYTGNNPYVAYQRKAKVKITTKLEGLDPFINIVPIYQVRRIVNPKGIYRDAGNNSSFHVVLKRLPGEDETQFVTFQSEGPWKAYVIKRTNGDGITLSATSDNTESKDEPGYGNVIYGKTGSVIDFNVDFSGSSAENRYAIIRVDYHNYTCQHLIFVRQGDKPDNLLLDGTGIKWYAQNMRTQNELASTPLDEGSLFKFGNWGSPIDAKDNKNPSEPWINITPEKFQVYPTDGLTNAETKSKMKWEEITSLKNNGTFVNPQKPKARVATYKDFWELREHDYIEQGYGVLYGNDATETADNIEEAYGYDYEPKNQRRGMRGCFVYNKENGKNLFFPIGASGYGHRKQKFTSTNTWSDSEELDGVLRYAAGRTKLYSEPEDRPLFYDIYRRPGAIYWFNQEVTITNTGYLGWDINYFTFDFNFIETANIIRKDGSDACFVRCVVDE